MDSEQEFDGRTVLVTGGTGALGQAVVLLLLERGAECVVPNSRGGAATALASSGHPKLRLADPLDLTSEDAVRTLFLGIPELWASVHCAGGFAATPFAEESVEGLEYLWRMNLLTAWNCSREAVLHFRRTGTPGRIVNVSARVALEPRSGAGMTSYTIAKSALSALTVALAEEVARDGIWVNAVIPSVMDTPANRSAMPNAAHDRWPAVSAVAETIVFLASPRNQSARGGLVPVYGAA